MEFITDPLEQTTAVTDLILGIMAVWAVFYLKKMNRFKPWKSLIWQWAFIFLALASLIGAVAHGFQMSEKVNYIMWQPLNLFLGMTIAFFVIGVIYDTWGEAASRRWMPIMIVIALLFFITKLVASLFIKYSFFIFIIYEAAGTLFALGAYTLLSMKKQIRGGWLMTVGVLITILAAGVQSIKFIHFTLIWEFNNNGAFHLIQAVALFFLIFGLRADLKDD